MAKSNPSFEKRIREQKKRAKKAEKARRKAERDAAKLGGTNTPFGAGDDGDADSGTREPDESA